MESPVRRLPLTIFESIYEGDHADDRDKAMQIDGQQSTFSLKFRKLPYSIETGEAEMISVDFVATGSGNASAIPTQADTKATTEQSKNKKKTKGTEETDIVDADDTSPLSREDEDCMRRPC